ncbi:MAG: bifunctional phosphoserine phosphatase/homoserine phosphotransferase ThrH [Gammaproteobacteria bacterium]|uniref:phosphoserine phosphatase n=1 Tax=OM182 bacterium MED-G24 TaxID=1986255 RepID=A0A2A5WTT2_9GAMM|nr:bifunctional phosphoserine phosphatase/homoserine phosphotransferase ThrH [Gammaproteobacteria bacterium]PDH39841.1 MAG: bifunctional phosphoserine phosphatase/homoserine phosphotransferase ThrH [OM182 bacterium MED-G24]RPG25619.1 MAG: bifunctional phosphoserine phosphatase/homoserine phosphotransferase ThrH [Gammaproteobacteria bacterium TMED50]|tara:strand:- start:13173 stop:13784 length:612 start_codon:yes stop_codon:yes gene_type:complete
MDIVCLDLEGVLIPEIWIAFSEKTGIRELSLTTRDIPDYDELMTRRLGLLRDNDLKLADIQAVISELSPLAGATQFLDDLRTAYQVIILSDTFYEFARPFMVQLNNPTLFCHRLETTETGEVSDYVLRQPDPKRASVKALHGLNFRTFAAGDSYNDTTMLSEADAGFLFRAPDNVIAEFPRYRHTTDYQELRSFIDEAAALSR